MATSVGLFISGSTSTDLCLGPFTIELFTTTPPLIVGSDVFLDSGGTIYPPAGYYSDGINTYFFKDNAVNTITPCPPCSTCACVTVEYTGVTECSIQYVDCFHTTQTTPIIPFTPISLCVCGEGSNITALDCGPTDLILTFDIDCLYCSDNINCDSCADCYFNLDTCDVIFNNSGSIYKYVFSTNESTDITTYFDPTIGSSDIAHTTTKLWIYSGTILKEYNITLCPFSASFSRNITLPSNIGAGLAVIDNTTLVSTAGGNVIEIDITSSTAVFTTKFPVPSGRGIAGDMVYTYSSPNKLLCLYNGSGSNRYITQHDYTTGNIETDVLISPTIPNPWGMFMVSGDLYICNDSGSIYNFLLSSPYTLTFTQTASNEIWGASQPPQCADVVLEPSTPTPTPTPTQTPTPPPIPCPFEYYCINTGDGLYDDTYVSGGTWNGHLYWYGSTSGLYIYFSLDNNRWCLSNSLNGECLLFGPSPCNNDCPDLCDDFFSGGPCPTPTPTPTDYCQPISFDVAFDCELPVTPTSTVTSTPTPTPTPTPTETEICGGKGISVTANVLTPTPTPTNAKMIATPTASPQYNCNFDGSVVFNTFDDYIRCNGSKRFKECNTGFFYYTTDVVLDPFGETPSEGYVYQSFVNGISTCITYDGFVSDIAGVSTIILTDILGPESEGVCSNCVIINTPTPTATVTSTPTPTPTKPTPTCYTYLIENSYISPQPFTYSPCSTGTLTESNINGNSSLTICSSTLPTSTSNFVVITNIGLCL